VVPVWTMYVLESIVVAALALSTHASLALPERASMPAVVGASALAVVVALSSVTSAITVLLGRVLDGARLAAHQWLAVAAVVAGLVLIRL
jgi:drug/metabolite transporter (DMT)-like permease